MVTLIEQQYIDLHPESAKRYAYAKDLFPNGVTHDARNLSPFPYYVTHAEAGHKWDLDGHRIVDYKTGHGALILGHSHPAIVAAVTDQMSKGTHYSASTELELQWAQLVCELIPSAEKIRFHSSGTEATMMALRMARAYTGKTKIIKFADHFHGWHDYGMTGGPGVGGIPKETQSTMVVLPPNDITAVESVLKTNNDVAGIILEPTGAHMGSTALDPNFLSELRIVTNKHSIVLVFDEVVTGFRVSKGGAQSYYGVTPDLTTMAKILGGGLPGGAVAGKADLVNMIELSDDPEYNRTRRIGHNGTFNANPLSAAAGVTALNLISTTKINSTADEKAQRLKMGLNDLLSRLEVPGCASGVSSVVFLRLGVEHECDKTVCLLSDRDQRISDDPARKNQLTLSLYNHGIDATNRFILSIAHTEQDIDDTVEATGQALQELRTQGLL